MLSVSIFVLILKLLGYFGHVLNFHIDFWIGVCSALGFFFFFFDAALCILKDFTKAFYFQDRFVSFPAVIHQVYSVEYHLHFWAVFPLCEHKSLWSKRFYSVLMWMITYLSLTKFSCIMCSTQIKTPLGFWAKKGIFQVKPVRQLIACVCLWCYQVSEQLCSVLSLHWLLKAGTRIMWLFLCHL